MNADTQPPKRQGDIISSLNVAIEVLNIAKEVSSITPAKAVFGTVSALLAMIKDSMINEADYVALGLTCADICTTLEQGTGGKNWSELNQPVRKAVERLRRTVEKIKVEIELKARSRSKLGAISSVFHAKNDKETIVAWRSDLNTILEVFNTNLMINTHVTVSDIQHDVSELGREISNIQSSVSQILKRHETHFSLSQAGSGESPPPPPRTLFGRDELIEKLVRLVDTLTPIALIGAGGIGKTSIALTILHHHHVKERFGDNRWFIRCDQFPATRTNFLRRLSKAIGAGVENPEDLTSLRPFLSSKEMLILLDNAESILDAEGTNAQEIYTVVEELTRFSNICLCITSRISTIPPHCESLDIPTLSMEAARDTLYSIYKNSERSNVVDIILGQLDFHPLSITLLATVAHQNGWNTSRLTKEWGKQRTDMLHTYHNGSLAAAIELSLSSPMFQELGPDARGLLGIVAFFPQGVDENNLDWLFPAISNREVIFDKFRVLSLTFRSNNFVTMLAPLRDYIYAKDPKSPPLLHAVKERYFSRLSIDTNPDEPGFEGTRWITSEDANIEHLLDVFTSIDANSNDVWGACAGFMRHLCWHKRRPVALGPKIEGLPDDHPLKPRCLFELSRLYGVVFNHAECRRLLIHTLKLWRERGDDLWIAQTLRSLAHVNWQLDLVKEGVLQAEEISKIYERLNYTAERASSLQYLALLLAEDGQVDAAEETALRAIHLCSGEPSQSQICEHHHILSHICRSRGEVEAAINHLETSLGIISPLNWRDQQVSILRCLVRLLLAEERFDDAQFHLERLKPHVVHDPYGQGLAMLIQAGILCQQGRFQEARSEVLRIINECREIGVSLGFLEYCKEFLREVEGRMSKPDRP